MKHRIYKIYNQIFRPMSFALWAMPKKSDLNIPRKRRLNTDLNKPKAAYVHHTPPLIIC